MTTYQEAYEMLAAITSWEDTLNNETMMKLLYRMKANQRRIKDIIASRIYIKKIVRFELKLYLYVAKKLVQSQDAEKELNKYLSLLSWSLSPREPTKNDRKRLLYYLELVDIFLEELPDKQSEVQSEIDDSDFLSLSDDYDLPKHLRAHPKCFRCNYQSKWLCKCGEVGCCSLYCEFLHKCDKQKND